MNQVLHPPLPLTSDHSFTSEQECIEHIGGSHAHHSSFAAAGVPEQLRREGALAHSTHIPLSSIASRSYGAPRPDTAYHTGSDSGTGSISTSPSSNASLASYSYSFTNQYPLSTSSYFNSAAGVYGMSAPRRTSTFTDASSSAMLPPARSPGLGNPVSPSMGLTSRDNYTTGTPGMHRHSHNLSPRYSDNRYSSQSDTPRSVLSATMPVSYQTGYSTSTYTSHTPSQETPPFNAQETYGSITCDGNAIVPNIDAKIEKGFFMSPDSVWTCYRRNYFAVNVSYGLSPWTPNLRLYYDAGNGKQPEQIQSMAVSLAAVVDGAGGKTIELIQHTPKRDKGPQLPMKKELLGPTPPGKNHDHGAYSVNSFHQSSTQPGPQFPLQHDGDASQQYSPTGHTNSNYQHSFERIQFKSATANNGKRRAQQQYYHLIVELWANVQSPRDQEPRWVKVAARSSQPVVVRGRSPSHYQNEMPHNGTRGPGSSGYGGSGQNGLGGRGTTSYSTFANGLSGSGSAMMSGNTYRGTTYSLDPSPIGSHSVSTASSLSGGPVENLVGDHHMMDSENAKMLDANHDYQYYTAGMYDGNTQKAEGTLLPPERRPVKEEFPGPAALATGWPIGGCGRYTGLETSRGSYPQDVHLY